MEYPKQDRNKVKRGVKKASYDRQVIYRVLDASPICHVAFLYDELPMVQPINFGRQGDYLYLHGSLHNRMTRAIIDAGRTCLEVSLLDAMKMSRSAFHHSVNYRSVVVFGEVRELTSEADKRQGLKIILNHFVPGRWDHCRPPSTQELNATRVVEVRIETASAKIATAPPEDKVADYPLDYWSGTIPIRTVPAPPIPYEADGRKPVGIPQHIVDFYQQNKDGF